MDFGIHEDSGTNPMWILRATLSYKCDLPLQDREMTFSLTGDSTTHCKSDSKGMGFGAVPPLTVNFLVQLVSAHFPMIQKDQCIQMKPPCFYSDNHFCLWYSFVMNVRGRITCKMNNRCFRCATICPSLWYSDDPSLWSEEYGMVRRGGSRENK